MNGEAAGGEEKKRKEEDQRFIFISFSLLWVTIYLLEEHLRSFRADRAVKF